MVYVHQFRKSRDLTRRSEYSNTWQPEQKDLNVRWEYQAQKRRQLSKTLSASAAPISLGTESQMTYLYTHREVYEWLFYSSFKFLNRTIWFVKLLIFFKFLASVVRD